MFCCIVTWCLYHVPDEFEEEGQEAKLDRAQAYQRVKPLAHVGPELLEAPVGVSPRIIQALVHIIDPFGKFALVHYGFHYTIPTKYGQGKSRVTTRLQHLSASTLDQTLNPHHAMQKHIDAIGADVYFHR